MKKILLFTAALAALLSAASCQKEEMGAVEAGNGNVSFTIQTPEDAVTKAIGDGTNVNIVYYEIYKANNQQPVGEPLVDDTVEMSNKAASLTLNLLEDQEYVALFWAQVHRKEGEQKYYNVENLLKVEALYPYIKSNLEERAAFYQKFVFSTENAVNETVTLVRPFAQLNIGTTPESLHMDYDVDVDVTASSVTVANPARFFNVNTGVGHTATTAAVVFGEETNPQDALIVNNDKYEYVAMNYILVDGARSTVNVDFSIVTDKGTVTKTVADVPVAQNYRTNLLGNLLRKETKIEIVVDERFNQPDPDINVEVMDEIPAEIDLADGNVLIPDLSGDQAVTVSGKGSIELQGTTITSTAADKPAITLKDGADVTLIITDNVTIEGATAGIVVPEGSVLKIVGSEEVVTKSGIAANNITVIGKAGSGIAGSVIIENVAHLTAIGTGANAYGIGAADAEVVISNSTIDYACGGFGGENAPVINIDDDKYLKATPEGAPAIGGKKIVINGSVITKADGGSKAAAIGARYWNSTEIEIVNSTIVEANGGNASAGIGGSRYSGDISADNKQVSKVKIEKSTVTATGGYYGAGIGAGYDTHCAANETNAVNEIVIINSTVNAQGGMYAAGIGSGYHSAALTGSIDAASTVNAVSGEKYYKDEYTEAQNIGYGVVDLAREGKELSVSFTVAGKKISAPAASYAVKENEVLIGSANGLKKLADAVNNGTDYYAAKTVKLTTDIDLNNVEWTPIGSATADHGFMGNFDGNGFVIKNLQMTALTPDADGYVYAGLFGVTEGTDAQNQNSIKNLVIENVNIQTEGNIAAAAIAYPYYTAIENVTVKGNVTIKGGHYTAGVLAYTRSCVDAKDIVIAANEGSYVEGNQTVGGVISDIQMNGGLKANYSNFSASGLRIKANKNVGGISGIICQQTLNGATVKNVKIVSESATKGIVSGADGGNGIVTNVVYENVEGTTRIIGAVYGSIEAATAEELTEALANGETVVMTQDITTEAATTAPYGNKYAFKMDGGVLDGSGHELYMECYGDDYGIMTSGGTIKNLTIIEGCRAVMIMYPQSDVILDNVNIGGDGVLYPINTGEAGAEGVNLVVTNSVLAGWTSYGLIESASFTNVEFKQGTYYNNIYGRVLKPYVNTTLTNCAFVEHMNLDLSALTAGHKVIMTNCTVNGQDVTAEVFTIPSTDAQYDTELFTVDLPSWASSINDCVVFN